MLTELEITKIAEKHIAETCKQVPFEVVLLNEYTIKKPYGNIYFYNGKKYAESRQSEYCLFGNVPFLVENKNGQIIEFGPVHDIEYYIQEYEAGRWVSIQKK